jgi:hypothetical protein
MKGRRARGCVIKSDDILAMPCPLAREIASPLFTLRLFTSLDGVSGLSAPAYSLSELLAPRSIRAGKVALGFRKIEERPSRKFARTSLPVSPYPARTGRMDDQPQLSSFLHAKEYAAQSSILLSLDLSALPSKQEDASELALLSSLCIIVRSFRAP